MDLLSELIAQQDEKERKWLEQITKLAHVREVMGLLCKRFDDFRWFVDVNNKPYLLFVGCGKTLISKSNICVRYSAVKGYQIEVNIGNIKYSYHIFDDYTGVAEDDAAKICEIIMKELM